MEITHVYLDECGNTALDLTKQGNTPYFIIAAVLVPESKVDDLTKEAGAIRDHFFPNGEIKSKTVGNKHERRIAILKKLAQLDFHALLLVVDKKKINQNSGLKYKQSFYKFMYQRVYEHLLNIKTEMVFHNDEVGRSEFMEGFKKYVENKNPCMSLFNGMTFEFCESKVNVLVQLADMIAGSANKDITEQNNNGNNKNNFLKILDKKLYATLFFPRSFKEFIKDTKFSSEEDKVIAEFCNETVQKYIVKNQAKEDEIEKQRILILNFMLQNLCNGGKDEYIQTKKLISWLVDCGYKETSSITFRRNIIAGLRDLGVIIASTTKGYKIPTSVKEIDEFIDHGQKIAVPLLKRLGICCNSIEIRTDGKISLLNLPKYKELSTILKALASPIVHCY